MKLENLKNLESLLVLLSALDFKTSTEIKIDNCLKDVKEAINYMRCCETLIDEKAPTIEVNLNTKESAYKRCNEITKILKTHSKAYLYDGENYIELKP